MILNESPINVPQIVSSDMINVLAIAQDVFMKTNGSFDPTVASLVNLWGFGPQLSVQKVPNDQAIVGLLNLIGLDKLLIDRERNLVTRLADIKIDLSAIAKGYAVDCVARLLDSYKIENYLIEVGGELRMKGNNVNGTKWIIAIERPNFIPNWSTRGDTNNRLRFRQPQETIVIILKRMEADIHI
jgi:thiamine biosynthesis lipoprotein